VLREPLCCQRQQLDAQGQVQLLGGWGLACWGWLSAPPLLLLLLLLDADLILHEVQEKAFGLQGMSSTQLTSAAVVRTVRRPVCEADAACMGKLKPNGHKRMCPVSLLKAA
jgi:hypothetical protein